MGAITKINEIYREFYGRDLTEEEAWGVAEIIKDAAVRTVKRINSPKSDTNRIV